MAYCNRTITVISFTKIRFEGINQMSSHPEQVNKLVIGAFVSVPADLFRSGNYFP